MIKKYIFSLFIALSLPMLAVYAAPTLMVNGSSDGTTVTVTSSGGTANMSVVLYYTNTNGTTQSSVIGTTDANGYFSGNVSTNNLSINSTHPVYLMVNGQQSSTMSWPYNSINNSGPISFSQASPSIAIGQDLSITINGPQGPYYVSSNSNPSTASSIFRGNILNVSGISVGTSVLTVCAYSNSCGTVTVTVNGQGNNNPGTNGSPVLSQSSISVVKGQSTVVTISGGTTPYDISIGDAGISTVLTGNALSVNGNIVGSNHVTVCSTNNNGYYNSNGYNGNCSTLQVMVTTPSGSNVPNVPASTMLSFALTLPYAQTFRIMMSGGSGSYYLQSQPNAPVLASLSGNTLMVSGSGIGTGQVVICSTGIISDCTPLSFNFVQPTGQSNAGTGGGYLFDTNLVVGMSGQDVSQLQMRLKDEGDYTYTVTGYYGPITEAAVMAYQKAHSISAVGSVGPQTRAMLNQ